MRRSNHQRIKGRRATVLLWTPPRAVRPSWTMDPEEREWRIQGHEKRIQSDPEWQEPEPIKRKLTAALVREMRAAFEVGETKASLARRFDVCERTVYKIVKGLTWRGVA